MSATKVNVASQTMCQTTGMSCGWITPRASATAAPPNALQPIPRPRGCQMTRTKVTRKIAMASMGQVSVLDSWRCPMDRAAGDTRSGSGAR